MTTLHIEHAITDYGVWKSAFDRLEELRRQSRVKHHPLLPPPDHPAYILVHLDVPPGACCAAALADLSRAIELAPGCASAIASRGETYRLMERYDEALADLSRAVDLDPGGAGALSGRGDTYRLMKRYDEALADLNRAVDLDPGYAWAIARHGATHRLN